MGNLMDEQNVLTSEWGEYSPQTKQSVFKLQCEAGEPSLHFRRRIPYVTTRLRR